MNERPPCAIEGCGKRSEVDLSAMADEGSANGRHAWPDGKNIHGRVPYRDFFTVPLCAEHASIPWHEARKVQMAAQRIASERATRAREEGRDVPTFIRVGNYETRVPQTARAVNPSDFPLLYTYGRDRNRAGKLDGVERDASIPWAMIAPHEQQAQRNHCQTLHRLAERGGLCPSEAVAVLEDRPWSSMDEDAATARLRVLVAEFKTKGGGS